MHHALTHSQGEGPQGKIRRIQSSAGHGCLEGLTGALLTGIEQGARVRVPPQGQDQALRCWSKSDHPSGAIKALRRITKLT